MILSNSWKCRRTRNIRGSAISGQLNVVVMCLCVEVVTASSRLGLVGLVACTRRWLERDRVGVVVEDGRVLL